MKTRIFLISAILLLTYSIAISNQVATGNNPSKEGSVNVFTSPDLYHLTMMWACEYNKLNPLVRFNVINCADNDIAGALNSKAGIGFISNKSYASINHQSAWNMVVGRDVIVPVMNAKNPFLSEINRKGITPEGLLRIFSSSAQQNWGMLLGNGQNVPVHCFIMNDASVTSGIANFLNNQSLALNAATTASGQEMISAIQKDPDALGFCRLTDVVDLNNQNLAGGLKLVPIDKNGNGKIDFMEDIYDNLQAFSRGVWIGKYPKALSGNIYAVASEKPVNEAEVAFLRWTLEGGQQFLNTYGYSDLVYSERQTQSDKLNNTAIYLAAQKNDTYALIKAVLMIVAAFALFGFFVSMILRRFSNHTEAISGTPATPSSAFDQNALSAPKGLYFDKTHTWAFMEKDGSVKVGIDDFLQHITGPLTAIGMKPAGIKIKKGDPLLTIIQKGKHLIIYSPVSGTITAANQSLTTNASALNTAPYNDGWVYMIEPANWQLEIQFLSMAEKYTTWLKGEFSRLKDFLATIASAGTPEYAFVALQDGGELKDNILAELGPEVWEDFQTKFIDNAK